MDTSDIARIEKIISDRKEANGFLIKNSAMYRAFVAMGGGPATVSSRFAVKVLEYYRQKA